MPALATQYLLLNHSQNYIKLKHWMGATLHETLLEPSYTTQYLHTTSLH